MSQHQQLRKLSIFFLLLFILLVLLLSLQIRRQLLAFTVRPQGAGEQVLNSLLSWGPIEQIEQIILENSRSETPKIVLQNRDSGWELDFSFLMGIEGAKIPLEKQRILALAENILTLQARVLHSQFPLDRQRLQRYGLDEAQAWFKARLQKIVHTGIRQTDARLQLQGEIVLGAKVPSQNAYYGLASSAQKNKLLFMVKASQVQNIAPSIDDLRKHTLARIALLSSSQKRYLKSLDLRSAGRRVSLRYQAKTHTPALVESKFSSVNILPGLVMIEPYVRGVDQYQLEQWLRKLSNPLSILQYVEDQPSDLGRYGLKPLQRRELYLEDSTGAKLDLWLGSQADADSVFAMEGSYSSVFTVTKDVLQIFQLEPFRIVDKFLILMELGRTRDIRFEYAGRVYRFQVLQQPRVQGVQGVQGLLGRRRINERATIDLYQEFSSLFLVGELVSPFFAVGKPIASLVYTGLDGSQRRADFYRYSAKAYYAVSLDGKKFRFLTEKRQLEKLEEAIMQTQKTGQVNILR